MSHDKADSIILASFVVLVVFVFFVCFNSYLVFSIAVFPHSLGVVSYNLLLIQDTRNPGVAPISF